MDKETLNLLTTPTLKGVQSDMRMYMDDLVKDIKNMKSEIHRILDILEAVDEILDERKGQ